MLEQQEQPIQKIGDYLKMYRERAQLSREELSLRTDYSHSHIYSVERGTSKPTMQYIEIVSPHRRDSTRKASQRTCYHQFTKDC